METSDEYRDLERKVERLTRSVFAWACATMLLSCLLVATFLANMEAEDAHYASVSVLKDSINTLQDTVQVRNVELHYCRKSNGFLTENVRDWRIRYVLLRDKYEKSLQ